MEINVRFYSTGFSLGFGDSERIHIGIDDLLRLEQAIELAKREALIFLPRSDWHKIDPKLAKGE